MATTLALLRASHERGEASYLESYLPFVLHCVRLLPDDDAPIGAKSIQGLLKVEFGIKLPLGVIRSLLRGAADAGSIREDKKLYFAVPEQLADCDLTPAREQFGREFTLLAAELAQLAQERHELKWGLAKAKSLLVQYVDGFSSDILYAAIGGRPLPRRAPHQVGPDLFVVHEFAAWIFSSGPDEFKFLVGLVKARMLSDSLYLDIQQGQEETLTNVEVYFDGPILLYVLGSAGEEIQAPYLELIDMLKSQGAALRCFHHSVVEAQGILDVAAVRKSAAIRGEQYYGDVVGFLVRSDRTRTDIELQANSLPRDLQALGIEEVDMPDRIPRLQPDEEALEKLIQDVIPTIKPPALLKDVDSLMGIHTLRRGRVPRTISSSRAVLVTHNYALFKASARFFSERHDGRTVPHCVYDASFTTLVWLHEPKQFPNVPREFVLADAAAALQPSDELWRRCNDAAQALFEAGEIDEEDLRFLRTSHDAQGLLMGLTRGSTDAFTDATLPEILELYRQRSVREVAETARHADERLAAEQTAHESTREEVEAEREKQVRARVRLSELSDSLAGWFSNCIFVLLVILLGLGVLLGPVGPVDTSLPLVVQLGSAAFAIGFAVWVGAFGGSLWELRDQLAARIARRIERVLLGILQLP